MQLNSDLEYQRNRERYVFLRWGQDALRNFRVVPPDRTHDSSIVLPRTMVQIRIGRVVCCRLFRILSMVLGVFILLAV